MTTHRLLGLALLLVPSLASAGELPDFDAVKIEPLIHTAIGVTRRETPIAAFVTAEDAEPVTKKSRVLLIGGLDGQRESVDAVLEVLKWFYTHEDAAEYRKTVLLSAVPCANPDGVLLDKGEENGAGGKPGRGYPPEEKFYLSKTNVEAQYLWRWLGLHGPDIVIDVRVAKETSWGVPKAANQKWVRDFATEGRLQPQHDVSEQKDRLIVELAANGSSLSGRMVALEARFRKMEAVETVRNLLYRQATGSVPKTYEARSHLQRAHANVASAPFLAFEAIQQPSQSSLYFDTLPLIGAYRISPTYNQLFRSLNSRAVTRSQVVTQLQSAFDIDKPPRSSSELSGRLWAIDWARHLDGDASKFLIAFARQAADLAFDKNGQPLKEPPFHNQMSDAVFMNGPILTGVGALTGEKKYFDACAQHQAFIRELCRREDNLYRHSPLCEAAWGRGNGFVALGHALMLEDLPEDHPARKEILAAYQAHIAALKQHQDYTGMWHQVIDHPESYREFSCTCMIGFAMARGIRGGWLDEETYQPCVEQAWRAIAIRSLPDGRYVDVCTGTGKQKTLRDYYDREAILGKDSRAISMSWMFASEVLR